MIGLRRRHSALQRGYRGFVRLAFRQTVHPTVHLINGGVYLGVVGIEVGALYLVQGIPLV